MLTDTQIRNLKSIGKPKKYADSGGLYLYISKTGSKLWRMAYRFNNKEKLLSFGEYPIVSLKDARAKRDDAKKLLANGIDPSRHKREMKQAVLTEEANTFEDVVLEWHETQTVHTTEKDRERKLNMLKNYLFPTLQKRPISQITAQELLQLVKPLEKAGKVLTAHRVMQYCAMVFRYGIATGRVTRNIVADLRGAIRPHKKQHRATITSAEKIGILLNKLDNYHGYFQVKCALRLFPLVFVRSAELTHAQWSEFHFTTQEWHIPAERMKMRQTHIVPLASQTLAILEELHDVTGNSLYLFPSSKSTKKPISETTALRALRILGYDKDEMCIHGFRAMASTLLNEQGFNRDWIERQLAHKEKDNVRIAYNHAQYLPQRHEMMQSWANYLDEVKEKYST